MMPFNFSASRRKKELVTPAPGPETGAPLKPDAKHTPHADTVQLLDTPASKAYNHIHTLLVPAVLYASFGRLVKEPVDTLFLLLLPLVVLQVVFCCVCVPASSKTATATGQQAVAGGKASQPGQRRKAKQVSWQADIKSRVIPAILSTILSLFITTPPLLILTILHGAPVTTHIPHTVLLATHISLLATLPLFYTHGVDSAKWRTLYSLLAPVDELMGAALGTFLGAYVGAIPIPLDWDREWQTWPVTVVVGAYGGWAVGRTIGGWGRVKGKVIRFD